MNRRQLLSGTGASLLLLASGCGADSGSAASGKLTVPDSDVAKLGGQTVVDELKKLYAAAAKAGQRTITVYGPGENDRTGAYKVFTKRFPGIRIKGEYLVGANLSSKINQEFASGKHIADVVQNGDTTAAAQLKQGRFVEFRPASAGDLPADYADGNGLAHAASALAFGPAYNTEKVSASDAPKSWQDMVDPRWRSRMVIEDPTSSGSTASTLSHLLWDGRYSEQFVRQLAAQRPRLAQNAQAAGTSIATGEFDLLPIYPYSFFLRSKAKGAPVGFVFPVEGGNHTSPHFLSLLQGARNPDAAKLFITWMFTPEAQQAIAEVGQWGTMPAAPGPSGYPGLDKLDLLKPFPLNQVGQINNENIAKFKKIFA